MINTQRIMISSEETKIPFKVSARTAKLIGMENFANEEGAIIELVKNTYDADSKQCLIIFDIHKKQSPNNKKGEIDKERSKIYIIDDGEGMTENVIKNQWMTIGTDNKLSQSTSKEGRVKTGAKGIGRFALNKLGLVSKMYTVPKNSKTGYIWEVDWKSFDKKGANVSDINATLKSVQNLNINAILDKIFNNQEQIKYSLSQLSFEHGTIIEVSEINDNWEIEQQIKLFSNLETLLPPIEQNEFIITMFSIGNPEMFGRVRSAYFDDYDYKVEATYNDDNNIEIKITRNELDVDLLERDYNELFSFETMQLEPYRLEDFKKENIVIYKGASELISHAAPEILSKVGSFDFTFYFLKNTIQDDKSDGDIRKYPYKPINSANRKSWLKKFGGVKIFRDDFRIRPYGENGEDWLMLGERQAQSPSGAGQKLGGYRIRPNQIAGTIKISRLHNESFQDKSGREGIIENEVFDLFKNIIKEIIAVFEKDRNQIMFNLSKLYSQKNKEAEKKRLAINEARKYKEEQGITNRVPNCQGPSYSEREKTLAEGIEILSNESDRKDDEIRLLRSLASTGLIISSFAHELRSLRSRLIPRTSHLVQELKKHLDESSFDQVDQDDNPYYMIQLIQREDLKLKHWLDYSLTSLKRDRRQRNNLNFSDYFTLFKSTWGKALEQRNIEIQLNGDEDCIIRAFEVDMDSIFNNLLSNSIAALKGYNPDKKVVSISWKKINDNIEIIFTDNGKGLDNKYRSNPYEIFNLNESSRVDKMGNIIGTGLGLYIVRSIIEEYNDSTIAINNIENGFSLRITFKIRS